MSQGAALKDQLLNRQTVGQLAQDYARVIPGFDRDRFLANCLEGFPAREFMQRLEWVADCLEPWLPAEFPRMADLIEAAMPAPLDPSRRDGDFGQFVHAVPGILAVRHGLEHHRDRALDLLHAATQRFSMEFYIRPFLNRWPDETLARLGAWAEDPNYHVRRLVSEGTRPRLPWAARIALDPMVPLPLLDKLHADPTRFVTRSVANHLNDISKIAPGAVHDRLAEWKAAERADARELGWITRHALRSLIKAGDPQAMTALGYSAEAAVSLDKLVVNPVDIPIGGSAGIEVVLSAPKETPVLVDYVLHLRRANGTTGPKVFKLKQAVIAAGRPLRLRKDHRFKGDATTFTLHPGAQELAVQVNGRVLGRVGFTLTG